MQYYVANNNIATYNYLPIFKDSILVLYNVRLILVGSYCVAMQYTQRKICKNRIILMYCLKMKTEPCSYFVKEHLQCRQDC